MVNSNRQWFYNHQCVVNNSVTTNIKVNRKRAKQTYRQTNKNLALYYDFRRIFIKPF